MEAAAVADEGAVLAYDAVAGDDDGDGVAAVGEADGAAGGGAADGVGDLAVGACLAVGDVGELCPYAVVEVGSAGVEGDGEAAAGACEVLVQLAGGGVVCGGMGRRRQR